MKHFKIKILLSAALFTFQPLSAISWDIFKWENFSPKKALIAAASFFGIGSTIYWIHQKGTFFKQKHDTKPAQLNKTKLELQEEMFQEIANRLGINIEVNFTHLERTQKYKCSFIEKKDAFFIDFNPYSIACINMPHIPIKYIVRSQYKISTQKSTDRSIPDKVILESIEDYIK